MHQIATVEHNDVTAPLIRSLQAQAVVTVGDLLWHVERGVFADFVSAWRRFHQQHEQPMSTVAPCLTAWRWGRGQDQIGIGMRLEQFQIGISPLFRNLTAIHAAWHWAKADATVYGLCHHEGEFYRWLSEKAQKEAARADEDDEQLRLQAEALEHANQAEKFRRLAAGDWQ